VSTDRPRVLAAGDDFVLTRLLVEAVRAEVGEEVETTGLDLPWPHTPFGDVGEGSSVVHEASGSEDELIAALDGARACVTQMAPITRRVLEACPDLELVAISRGGPVNADLVAARERGVTVTFAPGRNASATAEYTIAMMLAAMRRIPASHAGVQAGQWPSSLYAYDETGLEIEGSTVGLVGCGAIGSRVARVLSAFGAEVLVHDPYADPATLPEHSRAVELDELLSRSQVVTLHARVTEETTGILNDAALAALPDGAVVVNCARGALLDYAALAAHHPTPSRREPRGGRESSSDRGRRGGSMAPRREPEEPRHVNDTTGTTRVPRRVNVVPAADNPGLTPARLSWAPHT